MSGGGLTDVWPVSLLDNFSWMAFSPFWIAEITSFIGADGLTTLDTSLDRVAMRSL